MSTGKSQKSKNTSLELALRAALRGQDMRGYRLHHRIELPRYRNKPQHCTPDVAFVSAKIAVFADGDWWHGCLKHQSKISSAEWRKKQAVARARDQRHSRYLVSIGWRVFRFFECEDPKAAAKAIRAIADVGAVPGIYGLPDIPPPDREEK